MKRFITCAKASTAHGRPNRPSRLDSRRHAAQALICRPRLQAPASQRSEAHSPRVAGRAAGSGRQPNGPARRRAGSSASRTARHRVKHSRVRQSRRPGGVRSAREVPRHAKRHVPENGPVSAPRRNDRMAGPTAALSTAERTGSPVNPTPFYSRVYSRGRMPPTPSVMAVRGRQDDACQPASEPAIDCRP